MYAPQEAKLCVRCKTALSMIGAPVDKMCLTTRPFGEKATGHPPGEAILSYDIHDLTNPWLWAQEE